MANSEQAVGSFAHESCLRGYLTILAYALATIRATIEAFDKRSSRVARQSVPSTYPYTIAHALNQHVFLPPMYVHLVCLRRVSARQQRLTGQLIDLKRPYDAADQLRKSAARSEVDGSSNFDSLRFI